MRSPLLVALGERLKRVGVWLVYFPTLNPTLQCAPRQHVEQSYDRNFIKITCVRPFDSSAGELTSSTEVVGRFAAHRALVYIKTSGEQLILPHKIPWQDEHDVPVFTKSAILPQGLQPPGELLE
jgi:hypothetical protein